MTGVASVPNVFASATKVQTPQWDANWTSLVNYINDPTNRISFSADTGAANAYVLAPSPAVAYANNYIVWFIPANTNTTASTATANGLGALNIYLDSNSGPVALAGGEIVKNNLCGLSFDPTLNSNNGGWHLLNSAKAKQPTITSLTSGSGTYTTPAGAVRIVVQCWGGGASGGGGDNGTHRGTGGAGGGYCKKQFSPPAATYAYAVGAGGTAVGVTTDGNPGGNTTFGALTANGGAKGLQGNGAGIGGSIGGSGSGGDENITGVSSTSNGDGTSNFVSVGGDAPRGGSGAKNNVAQNGNAPGGGGSAANATGNSGAGAAGQIFIDEYYY